MIYATKGSFIQALKDIKYLKEKLEEEKQMLDRFEYLRYGKIKSPLDYEITGYKSKEAIRALKIVRTPPNSELTNDRNEALEKQIDLCITKIERYNKEIKSAYAELEKIDEPLKSILTVRFVEQRKLRYVCKKFKQMYLDESGMYKYIMRELDRYYN